MKNVGDGVWIKIVEIKGFKKPLVWHYECSLCGAKDMKCGESKVCKQCGANMRKEET